MFIFSLQNWICRLSWILYFLFPFVLPHILAPSLPEAVKLIVLRCWFDYTCFQELERSNKAEVLLLLWQHALVTCTYSKVHSAWVIIGLFPLGLRHVRLQTLSVSAVNRAGNKSNLDSEFTLQTSELIYCRICPQRDAKPITRFASLVDRMRSIPDIIIILASWCGQ